jgi:hypothetical protein
VHATRTADCVKMLEDGFNMVTPTSDIHLLATSGAQVLKDLAK